MSDTVRAQFFPLRLLLIPYQIISGLVNLVTVVSNMIYLFPTLLYAQYTFKPKPLEQLRLGAEYYRAPGEFDHRTPCPGLNALANHGVIPHDGKKVSPVELYHALRDYYSANFPSCWALLSGALQSSWDGRTIDLGALCRHNLIEHDASLTRPDSGFGDQRKADPALLKKFISCSKDGKYLTIDDIGRYRVERVRHSKEINPTYSLDLPHRILSYGEPTLLLDVFGDGKKVSTHIVESFMAEERFPNGYVPKLLRTNKPGESLSLLGSWSKAFAVSVAMAKAEKEMAGEEFKTTAITKATEKVLAAADNVPRKVGNRTQQLYEKLDPVCDGLSGEKDL
ncbi:Cloroperoxidase [Saitoella complicata NRRL Y-17804]|uniref:Cloroperoxidase n=1 Tax=Saitoella complicata (strain BCRC 22490 / CBS 7301 / JCM 7358 / NBRC 10748 / NRRL Y-17804) TaxID=698492 RepID=UPI000866BE06|nr:Cloroperoxidase [Saitoella complicata NRRL Y-17804]ODQ54525.1 Cloroperoxidase [Saitoella complicata NRRL Y-17804]